MIAFHEAVSIVSFVLNLVGALVAIYGVVIAFCIFATREISLKADCVKSNESIRIKLGSYLVLALEFFIAGDIIKTIITPTWEGLGILGAIVVIRTILSYFLTRDIKKI